MNFIKTLYCNFSIQIFFFGAGDSRASRWSDACLDSWASWSSWVFENSCGSFIVVVASLFRNDDVSQQPDFHREMHMARASSSSSVLRYAADRSDIVLRGAQDCATIFISIKEIQLTFVWEFWKNVFLLSTHWFLEDWDVCTQVQTCLCTNINTKYVNPT